MDKKQIEIKTVKSLMTEKFFIPSYQRGYRWEKQQVEELLVDINNFEPIKYPESDDKSWYCLQPLVVKKKDKEWEVIDGQQRLTTIFLILKCLGEKFTSNITYETRPESTQYIENILNNDSEEYIDFHYMHQAKETVLSWKESHEISNLLNKLENDCKVIWYETEDDAYDVFKRLNSGKIPLSNAELVKALLLKKENFLDLSEKYASLKQYEMACEWDRMEQLFQDDQFWYFICPDPENAYYESTRFDFLLEMMIRCGKNNSLDFGTIKFQEELIKNPYFIFSEFNNQINNKEVGWQIVWLEILNVFRIFKAWYQKRDYYHYIGYLINLKGKSSDKNKEMLVSILKDCNLSKPEFIDKLKEKCRKTLVTDKQPFCDFSQLKYNEDNVKIHNILLLFNLATVQNQISEQSRYPFNLHYKANKEKWSLEHIHAQNEEKADLTDEDAKKISHYMSLIKDSIKIIEGSEIVEDSSAVEEFISKILELYKDKNFYKAIIGAFMGEPVIRIKNTDEKGNITYNYTSGFEEDHTLTNMALLQGPKNSAFNNSIYPEKKEKLAAYENTEFEAAFIPICTRNVFFKHYSPKSTNPLLWDKEAGIEYVTAIVKTISNYIDAVPVIPEASSEYGIKIK